MGRFVEGEGRSQSTLLPARLDDYVTKDNPVRVVDVFVDNLDLATLGFTERSHRPPAVRAITRPCC